MTLSLPGEKLVRYPQSLLYLPGVIASVSAYPCSVKKLQQSDQQGVRILLAADAVHMYKYLILFFEPAHLRPFCVRYTDGSVGQPFHFSANIHFPFSSGRTAVTAS